DVIIAMIHISGSSAIAIESLNNWLLKKLEGYYQTAGTVTFAMKTLVETLNSDLLDRNLKRVKEGIRMAGMLNLVVLRRDSLYLVNIGPAKAWFAGKTNTLEFADTDNQGRGLGVDQNLSCRFSTCELAENDTLAFSCQPPEIWNADTFSGCNALTNEAVGRRIYNQVGSDLKAVLLRFSSGKGQIKQESLPGRPSAKAKIENSSAEIIEPEVQAEPTLSDAPVELTVPIESMTVPVSEWNRPSEQPLDYNQVYSQTDNIEGPDDVNFVPSTEPFQIEESQSGQAPASLTLRRRTGSLHQDPKPITPKPEGPSEAQVAAGKVTQGMVSGAKAIGSSVSSFTQKVLPGLADEPLKLSRGTLIAIAIAVPMLIVLLAGAVYARSGKSKQFNQNLILAQQYAMQAELQVNDPPVYLASLQQSMFWLDKAES
ncbi:MAG: hypothetical protein CVU45_07675, partial [Chloroflexi bacterium HGW-Chloroflexi-7]